MRLLYTRFLLLLIQLSLGSIVCAQTAAVSVNLNGSFTYSQVGNIETVVIGTSSGSVSPFGPAMITGSFQINYGASGNPLTGSFTFAFPSSASFTVSYSMPYQTGAEQINFATTVESGTGPFSGAAGSLQLQWNETVTGHGGNFTLLGSGTLTGTTLPGSTPTPPITGFPTSSLGGPGYPISGPGGSGQSLATCSISANAAGQRPIQCAIEHFHTQGSDDANRLYRRRDGDADGDAGRGVRGSN